MKLSLILRIECPVCKAEVGQPCKTDTPNAFHGLRLRDYALRNSRIKPPNLQNIPIRTEVGNKLRAAFIKDKNEKLSKKACSN